MAVLKKETFKISKSKVNNDETKALQLACEKFNTSDRFLKSMHTTKTFVFEKIR